MTFISRMPAPLTASIEPCFYQLIIRTAILARCFFRLRYHETLGPDFFSRHASRKEKSLMGLSLERVSHGYGKCKVFPDISLSVADGEIVCMLGPSGCGKTTLLRLAAGLEKLQTGRVTLSGSKVADQDTQVPPGDQGGGAYVPRLCAVPPFIRIRQRFFRLK